ncbi:MAG: hypothetical protein AABY22_01345, partial [Nanoarchaeota archaeon]
MKKIICLLIALLMISVVLAERPTQKIRQINPETLVMETVENISQQQNISRKPEIIGLELALTKVTNEIAKVPT